MKSFAEAGARSPGTAWDTLVQAVLSLVVGLTLMATASQAKIAGSTHCYNGVCHRVWTVEETRAAINAVQRVTASHYDSPERDRFNPRLETSSGESFHAGRADNAASPIFPDGTKLMLWNEATGVAAAIRINNAGPYHPGRQLDVSRALAERLGFAGDGVAVLHVVVIAAPTEEETGYKRGRKYPTMQGVLGQFGTIELALLASDDAVTAMLGAETTTTASLTVAGWRRVADRVRPARSPVGERVVTAQAPKAAMPLTATAPAAPRHTAADRSWTGRFYD